MEMERKMKRLTFKYYEYNETFFVNIKKLIVTMILI